VYWAFEAACVVAAKRVAAIYSAACTREALSDVQRVCASCDQVFCDKGLKERGLEAHTHDPGRDGTFFCDLDSGVFDQSLPCTVGFKVVGIEAKGILREEAGEGIVPACVERFEIIVQFEAVQL
jgi:hypothetical protein